MGGCSTTHVNDNLSDIEIIIIMKIPVQVFFAFCLWERAAARSYSVTLPLCHLSLNLELETAFSLALLLTCSLASSSRLVPRTLLFREFLPPDQERSE